MSTPNIDALKKTSDALTNIKQKLQPVIEKLNDDDDDGFDKHTPQAQATVALSIGMLKYIGARLQGKDQGRKPDDPLRKELNNMKRVLAEIKKKARTSSTASSSSSTTTTTTTTTSKKSELPTTSSSKETSTPSSKGDTISRKKRKSSDSNSDKKSKRKTR